MSLANYTEELLSKIVEDFKGFYAFSKEQFDEQKHEGITYISYGMGLYVDVARIKEFKEKLDTMVTNAAKKRLEVEGAEKIIRFELNNYECYYVGSIEDALPALQIYGFSEQQIQEVFNKTFLEELEHQK